MKRIPCCIGFIQNGTVVCQYCRMVLGARVNGKLDEMLIKKRENWKSVFLNYLSELMIGKIYGI